MCGIGGLWRGRPTAPGELGGAAARVRRILAHRGPDDSGQWADAEAGLVLAHTRLAVRGLGPEGAQPMRSHSGRTLMVFNGEIYNDDRLRSLVDARGARQWRGRCDTETFLESLEAFGPERALKTADGMFAFAAWDRATRELIVGRDRFGEKPLYYGRIDGSFLFASEPAVLEALAGRLPEIDPAALGDFLQRGYIPAPRSIYRGVGKLPPGSFLRIGDPAGGELTARRYWDPIEAAREARAQPFQGGYEDAVRELASLMERSCASRTAADVPLGLFLSGGIDSSLVACATLRGASAGLETFSVGSPDPDYDESGHARGIAAALGTRHSEIVLEPAAVLDTVARLGRIYSEPFADASAIPTLAVSRLARGSVKVALSGDGGDELFGGYNRHARAPLLWRAIAPLPVGLRPPLAALLRRLAGRLRDRPAGPEQRLVRAVARSSAPAMHLEKLAASLEAASFAEFYRLLASSGEAAADPLDAAEALAGFRPAEYAMLQDTLHYLPDDILVKVDRASMHSGLEVRSPFLSPELFGFAWSLPQEFRIRGGVGKRILRDALAAYLPRRLFERPKQGFAIPLDGWLRNELREWAEWLLSPASLGAHGLLCGESVQRLWQSHLEGSALSTRLWSVLMFQNWYLTRGDAP